MLFQQQGPAVARGAALSRSLTAQKVFPHDLDARVRNVSSIVSILRSFGSHVVACQILELVNRVQPSGVPENAEEGLVDTPELRALLREAAAVRNIFLRNIPRLTYQPFRLV